MKLGSSLVIAAVLTFSAAGFTQDVEHDTTRLRKMSLTAKPLTRLPPGPRTELRRQLTA